MVKDYFQDIVPPDSARPSRDAGRRMPVQKEEQFDEASQTLDVRADEPALPERSIRNIPPPLRRPRTQGERREVSSEQPVHPRPSRLWMWIAAGVSVLILAILVLFVFRSTTVTVIPRSHPVVFDQSAQFIAYPAARAPAGTLSYIMEVSDFEDSEVVPSNGTEHAETKASGSIIITNDYSAAPVKLIKDTRFQDGNGLIFRIPADVIVPGRSGNTRGQISVVVVADKPGEQYNIGPTSAFTIPGLKSNAAMFSGVRGHSAAAMTGGFVGDRPAVESGATQAAQAAIRTRITQKVSDGIGARQDAIVVPDLVRITFQSSPGTPEAGGGVRIHEKAHVEIPIFPKDAYAKAVATAVLADAKDASVTIVPGEGYAAHSDKNATAPLGQDPLSFSLLGQATIVWNVDGDALARALAGIHEAAFQNVVTTFPSIQEAHARIEPFWKSSFPTDPSKIKIVIEKPAIPTP